MATDEYISPYKVDDAILRSVMAAEFNNKSIQEVHERDSRDSTPKIKPTFDSESFSGALGTITVVIEGLCYEGAKGWDVVQRKIPKNPRVSSRLFSIAPILVGNDRATLSLYDPLENLEEMLKTFLGAVEAWANKPKYFKEVALPFIIRTIEYSTSEASIAKKLRKELKFVGPIDMAYVNSFENISRSMREPILELSTLAGFIASILREGDEISPHSTPGKPTLPKASLSNPSSHFAKILNPVPEASGSRRPVETKSASTLPTSSPYFNTILNPEPTAQGNEKTVSTASQHGGGRSGFEDLLEAAGYTSGSNKKSPTPEHEPEREPTIDLQYPGSPSYSPPPSPSLSVDTLLKPFSVSSIKAEEPSPDISSSILLEPSSLHQIKPSLAPPGTPQWKIDLSARKGHPIHILHVGPRELDILSKCLPLVHKATIKGEECMRTIIEHKDLATEMEQKYKQWDEVTLDLENNVSIDKKEAREKHKEESAHTKVDDDGKRKGKAKDPYTYGASGNEGSDWSGTGNPRDYGRIGPKDAKGTWGYRKVEPPSTTKAVRRGSATSFDLDETEDEDIGAPRDFGMGSTSPTEHDSGMGSPMSESSCSDDTEGIEEVMNFEEAFEEGEGEDQDQEMLDVDDVEGLEQGEIIEEEEEEVEEEGKGSGNGDDDDDDDGKKGLKSGGRNIGLYGELL